MWAIFVTFLSYSIQNESLHLQMILYPIVLKPFAWVLESVNLKSPLPSISIKLCFFL